MLKIPMLAQKESTWASDQEGSYKTEHASFLSILYLRIWIKQSIVHSSRRWQKTLPQVRRMSTQPISRMHNIFCPSINMTKLITISRKINEIIMAKVRCPQKTMIILPLGMYPIKWKCPSYKWKDDFTCVALRAT